MKKRLWIHLAAAVVFAALIVAVILLAVQQADPPAQRSYYDMKCESFRVQNANLSKGQIVFIGDSITDLYVLDDHYGSLPLATYNRGIGGDTTAGVLERLQLSVFDLEPSIVVLMIGTNDVNGNLPEAEILSRYGQIVQAIAPKARLYCVSLIPEGDVLEESAGLDVTRTTATILRLNTQIRQIAQENGAAYIDLFPLLADDNDRLLPQYTDDGLHLNEAGLALWTAQLYPLLESARSEAE